jgi:hypothetical protein
MTLISCELASNKNDDLGTDSVQDLVRFGGSTVIQLSSRVVVCGNTGVE